MIGLWSSPSGALFVGMDPPRFLRFLWRRHHPDNGLPRSVAEEPTLDEGCPLGAHRRLLDAHRLWHQAASGYEDPAAFRTNLNACIEQLRSVTLVLQAERRLLQDFDAWYGPWRERLKQHPVLSWLNAARVQVFHVADLALNSRVRVSLLADPTGPTPLAEFSLPPDIQLANVVAEIRRRPFDPNISPAVAIVERRWIANDLPDHELLDALAICFRFLDELVASAHAHVVKAAQTISSSQPECLAHASDFRTARIDLATGSTMRFESFELVLDSQIQRTALRRYGAAPSGARMNARATPPELAEAFSERAKTVLVRDGHHVPLAVLLLPEAGSLVQQMLFADAADKLLHWQRIAVEVERVGARGLVFVAEAWVGSPDNGRVVSEALHVTLAQDDGTVITWSTRFRHLFGRIKLGPTALLEDQRAVYLDPVQRVWRLRQTGRH